MHLLRVVGSQLLTYEEMLTVLVQIEAILKSRPLSAMSCDPSEPLALTPAHFLTLTPLTSLPVRDLSHENVNLLQRKRIIDHLVQSFWKRWQIEYLTKSDNTPLADSTNSPANRNGLLELRARAATQNKTRRRPVVATRRKLKYYR
ncbi:hypothetical protein EVAR_20393_1 [Eumeta japonica]|uniref:DUF5641 domain-containing protein n=1 Tax=Eumeta variegata TaxID=151549 RepID=A0A4C1TXS0_EUMVA|nr:hypothetical protein EVAR_20393_1 [Eumeta japonica]